MRRDPKLTKGGARGGSDGRDFKDGFRLLVSLDVAKIWPTPSRAVKNGSW